MVDLYLNTESKLNNITYEQVKISNLKGKEERFHKEIKTRQELQERITEIKESNVDRNRCKEKDKEIEKLASEANLLKYVSRTCKKVEEEKRGRCRKVKRHK